jgi:hypothetical protein
MWIGSELEGAYWQSRKQGVSLGQNESRIATLPPGFDIFLLL